MEVSAGRFTRRVSKTRVSTVARAVESCPNLVRAARRSRARDEERRSERSESTSTARGWGGVRYTTAIESFGVCVTAVIVVRWKPSTRSRSLSDISSLSALPARIGVAEATPLTTFAAGPSRPSSPPGEMFVWSATERSTSSRPVRRTFSWRTERARAGRGERSERSRLSDPYPRECGAVRMSERGYVAEATASGPRAFIALRRLRLRSHRFQLASGPKAFNAQYE